MNSRILAANLRTLLSLEGCKWTIPVASVVMTTTIIITNNSHLRHYRLPLVQLHFLRQAQLWRTITKCLRMLYSFANGCPPYSNFSEILCHHCRTSELWMFSHNMRNLEERTFHELFYAFKKPAVKKTMTTSISVQFKSESTRLIWPQRSNEPPKLEDLVLTAVRAISASDCSCVFEYWSYPCLDRWVTALLNVYNSIPIRCTWWACAETTELQAKSRSAVDLADE